ncbi:MAG TPA: RES family NAD+ phosphorylase [Mucilaginibacter sp.]
MLVYRIVLSKYADRLFSPGRAGRWNPNDVEMIYAASSRSLACLENVVHRGATGLTQLFTVLVINIPDQLEIKTIRLKDLPHSWADFDQIHRTQTMGHNWIKSAESAILQVPSSIIQEETNFLMNPKHADFSKIKIVDKQPFIFDSRVKL